MRIDKLLKQRGNLKEQMTGCDITIPYPRTITTITVLAPRTTTVLTLRGKIQWRATIAKTGTSNKRLSHLQSPSRRWNNRTLRVETVGKPNDSFEKSTGRTSKGPRCESPKSTSSHKEASVLTSRTNSTYNRRPFDLQSRRAVVQRNNGKGRTANNQKKR